MFEWIQRFAMRFRHLPYDESLQRLGLHPINNQSLDSGLFFVPLVQRGHVFKVLPGYIQDFSNALLQPQTRIERSHIPCQ